MAANVKLDRDKTRILVGNALYNTLNTSTTHIHIYTYTQIHTRLTQSITVWFSERAGDALNTSHIPHSKQRNTFHIPHYLSESQSFPIPIPESRCFPYIPAMH